MKTHLIVEYNDVVTECGRRVGPRTLVSDQRHLVDCARCVPQPRVVLESRARGTLTRAQVRRAMDAVCWGTLPRVTLRHVVQELRWQRDRLPPATSQADRARLESMARLIERIDTERTRLRAARRRPRRSRNEIERDLLAAEHGA